MIKAFFAGVLRIGHFLAAAGFSLAAIGAVLGFASPLLDMLNHFQPLWFAGTLVTLMLTGAVYRGKRSRALMLALSATGFLASAITVMPEVALGLKPLDPPAAAGTPTYRIMTYNLFARNNDIVAISSVILGEDPDIVALQEYFPSRRRRLDPLLIPHYPYKAECEGIKRANIAIYSRIPFAPQIGELCHLDPERKTVLLETKFAPAGGPDFTVISTQLDWPLQISRFKDGHNIFAGLDLMTERQLGQFAHLASSLTTISGPVIVVGDFNSTPWSYALRRFAKQSGLTRWTRNLPTFPKLWYFGSWRATPPILPLDQIMSRDGVNVHSVKVAPPGGSDHLPVVASFTLTPVGTANLAVNP